MDISDNIYNGPQFNKLLENKFQWGIDRGITVENGASGLSQIKKLREELDELEEGLQTGDIPKIRDSIGDLIVVLQQIARLENLPIQTCLEDAWEDIKDRKGQMKHGVFVKQVDIDFIGLDVLEATKSAEEIRYLIDVARNTGEVA